MSTVVIGVTLADAEAFCQRNPDFSHAVRRSGRSRVKDGLIVTGLVLTPRAKAVRGGEREYVRHAYAIAQREMTRAYRGFLARGEF